MQENQKIKVACVIPAFNEEKNLAKVIDKVKNFVDEIIVVDDCSSDNTFEVAQKQGVIALRHLINRGQGAALETGNQYALQSGADIIVHFDADGQFLAEEIKDVISPIINNEVDVVFGSRFLEKKSDIPWFKETIIFNIARLINKFFLGVSLTDPQSGFRALNKQAATIIKIENDRMAHCSEIIYKVFKNNFKVKEVPITVIYNVFGQKFSGGIRILKDLLLTKLIN